MINLLPPEEKKELLLKNRERLVVILGITAFVSLMCLILILLSINFYILTEVVFQKNVLEQTEKSYKTPVFLSFQDTIKKYNNALTKLNYFYREEIYFSQILKIISNIQRPAGLYLTDISLNRNDENKNIKVLVSGFSPSREDLLIFKKNIEDDRGIKNPYFSPESWTNPQNVRFYLTFEIYKNEN
jgi:hypothetical protein